MKTIDRPYQKLCESCGAQLVFLKSSRGKNIPVDANSIESGDRQFDRDRHSPHWATCDDPKRFRRKR